MVMDYVQEFQRCHGTLDTEEEAVFIRATSVDAVSPYAKGRVWLYLKGRKRGWQVKADINEVVEWMNFYAPSVDGGQDAL